MGLAIIIPNVDFSDNNIGKVTVCGNIRVQAISIIGSSRVVGSEKYRISYYPINTSEKGVVWSIVNGEEYASIDTSTGLVTAKAEANRSSVTIRAVSVFNGDITTEKTILVSYEEQDERVTLYRLERDISGVEVDTGINFFDINTNTDWVMVEKMTFGSGYARGHHFKSTDNRSEGTLSSAVGFYMLTQNNQEESTGNLISGHSYALRRNGNILQWTDDGETWNNFSNTERFFNGVSSPINTNTTVGSENNENVAIKIEVYQGHDTDISDWF